MTRIVFVIIGLLLMPVPAKSDFAMMGWGTKTCSQLGNQLSNPTIDGSTIEIVVMTWVQGYMSGRNVQLLQQKQFRDMAAISTEDQQRMLFAYCNSHPFAVITEAANNLYFSLPLKQFTPPASSSSHR